MSTRWNSIFAMICSTLDLQKPIIENLKQIGKAELCLDTGDIDLITHLCMLLMPFTDFTGLVRDCAPNLSLVLLIRKKIQKLCHSADDSSCTIPESMKKTKQLVLKALDNQLPINDAVKLGAAFDPATRDAMLTKVEYEQVLTAAYNKI